MDASFLGLFVFNRPLKHCFTCGNALVAILPAMQRDYEPKGLRGWCIKDKCSSIGGFDSLAKQLALES